MKRTSEAATENEPTSAEGQSKRPKEEEGEQIGEQQQRVDETVVSTTPAKGGNENWKNASLPESVTDGAVIAAAAVVENAAYVVNNNNHNNMSLNATPPTMPATPPSIPTIAELTLARANRNNALEAAQHQLATQVLRHHLGDGPFSQPKLQCPGGAMVDMVAPYGGSGGGGGPQHPTPLQTSGTFFPIDTRILILSTLGLFVSNDVVSICDSLFSQVCYPHTILLQE